MKTEIVNIKTRLDNVQVAEPISYCVSSELSRKAQSKVYAWIKAQEDAGWVVEFRVRDDAGHPVVMWQCICHANAGMNSREFTDCIGQDGVEFSMN